MTTFKEANQLRLALKMKLSHYGWYNGSAIYTNEDDYAIVVHVDRLDDKVRKVIPPLIDGVSVKTEIDKG